MRKVILRGDDGNLRLESLAFQAVLSGDEMRQNEVTRELIDGPNLNSWFGVGICYTTGPINFGKNYNLTVIIDVPDRDKVISASDQQYFVTSATEKDLKRLRDMTSESEPRLQAIVGMMNADNCIAWPIVYLDPLSTWVSAGGHMTLVGDAAHAITPHVGQGAAISIEDGCVLAECIDQASSAADITQLLQMYESLRTARVQMMSALALAFEKRKHLPEGEEQRKRDAISRRMIVKPGASLEDMQKLLKPFAWILGYDGIREVRRRRAEGNDTAALILDAGA